MSKKTIPVKIPKKEVLRGIKVEMEHTTSRRIARKIALDHLKESVLYYKYLAQMEKRLRRLKK